LAEGETQYNIPVSSKQLIVYFVFLVIALSAAFLAGVMVGRNVDASPEPTVRDIQEDRLPDEAASSPSPQDLTYGSALQSDKIEGLATASSPTPRPTQVAAAVPKPSATPPRPAPTPAPVSTPRPQPAASTPRTTPSPKPSPAASSSRPGPTPITRLTIQVGAFRERSAAEAIVKRLKGKGYSAYMAPVTEGLFNVRVGSFTNREDAERIVAQLETQEKFKPFIVKP